MALYTAAENGHVDVVDVLLAAGEPLNVAGCRAPLLGALGAGQWAMALKLIRLGADLTVVCRNKPGVGDVLTPGHGPAILQLLTVLYRGRCAGGHAQSPGYDRTGRGSGGWSH